MAYGFVLGVTGEMINIVLSENLLQCPTKIAWRVCVPCQVS